MKYFSYLAISFSWLLGGCASLLIHDKRICAIGPGNDENAGAACDNVYSSNPQILTEAQWAALSPGWYCMSPGDESFAKQEIEEACSIAKCSYAQLQAMKSAFDKIENLRSQP